MNAKDFEVSVETTLRARIEGLQKALAMACRERDEAEAQMFDLKLLCQEVANACRGLAPPTERALSVLGNVLSERNEARGEVADLLSQLDAAGFESRRFTKLVEALEACADALQCHNQDDGTPEEFQNHWCNRCDEYADRSGEVRMKARALIKELGFEDNNVPA